MTSDTEAHSFVAGRWVSGTGDRVQNLNPTFPDDVLGVYHELDRPDVERAVDAAADAWAIWRRKPIGDRGAVLASAARLLFENAESFGRELTLEEGKPLREAIGEVRRAGQVFEYYAALATQSQGSVFPSPRVGETIFTLHPPLGVVVIITPWNFPIAIPAWKIAPALLYGNAFVWKPSELVPTTSVNLMKVLDEAGLPLGVGNLVFTGRSVGSDLLDFPAVQACSFTGSTSVGAKVSERAAQNGVRMQAELGGKNAAVVLADADIAHAVNCVVDGAMGSSGQRCTATSRLIVAEEIFDEFVGKVSRHADALEVGNPLDQSVDLGPLVSVAQFEKVESYLALGERQGATEVTKSNSRSIPSNGYFVSPRVLVGVNETTSLWQDEVFGPVLAALPAGDLEEALTLANHGDLGLSGAVFTRDLRRVYEAIEDFDVGVLHINSPTPGADVHVPFGGMKASGTAHREMGAEARAFYTEKKTVYLSHGY